MFSSTPFRRRLPNSGHGGQAGLKDWSQVRMHVVLLLPLVLACGRQKNIHLKTKISVPSGHFDKPLYSVFVCMRLYPRIIQTN